MIGVSMNNRNYMIYPSVLVSLLLVVCLSIPIDVSADTVFDKDLNGDGKVDVIDMVMTLNRNLMSGDTNNDARVDIFDLAAIGLAFGSEPGDPNWNPDADVANTVDKIDIFDLATVGKNFNIQKNEPPVLDPPVSVVPSSQNVQPGDNFDASIYIDTPVGVYAYDIIFTYDPGVINATSASQGNFLNKDGAATYPVISIDHAQGVISIGNTRFGVTSEVTGAGTLATMTFTALNVGTSGLDLETVTLVNANLQPIAGVTTNNGIVNVQIPCISHDHFACYNDDVFWYDSCDVREEKKEECGNDYCDAWGPNYCKDGDVYHSRTCYDLGCSGSACFSNPYTDEQLVESCPFGCNGGQCVVQCSVDSQCGTDGLVGSPVCSLDGDVYQDYRTYMCNNPGTKDSYCSHTDTPTLIEECGDDYCEAWGSNFCKDGNVYRSRTCHDMGCSGGSCYDTPSTEYDLVKTCQYGCSGGECIIPSCMNDSDCGTDGLVGNPVCSTEGDGDVYQDYRTYTCNNPGTPSSYCSHTDTPTLIEDCGDDSCDPWMIGTYCKYGDVYHSRTCYDRGCSDGSCFVNQFLDEQLVESCPNGCENGECIVQCSLDSHCGTDGLVGNPVCSTEGDGDVYQDYRTYTCNNPGTPSSYCSHTDTPTLIEECGDDYCDPFGSDYCEGGNLYRKRTCYDLGCSGSSCFNNPFEDKMLVEECQYGCENNACVIPVCVLNSDCGTDGWVGSETCTLDDVYQDYRTYTCNNPGTSSSYCSHTDTPTMKKDCGDDYCEAWGAEYCKDGDMYHSRTCHDLGCSCDACFDTPSTEEELTQACPYGCDADGCLLGTTVDIPEGISIFSLPLTPPGGIVTFSQLNSDCVVLDNGFNATCAGPSLAYLEPCVNSPCPYTCLDLDDPLYPGQGYFIRVSQDCTFKIAGREVQASQLGYLDTGIIKKGESLIGGPTQPVSFASVKGTCSIPEDPLLFLYDATACTGVPDYTGISYCGTGYSGYDYCYCSVSTLRPGLGYNIYAFDDCSFAG